MTDARIISDFAKCGTMHHLSRRFHNLPREGKEKVINDIRNGVDARKAIAVAKRSQVTKDEYNESIEPEPENLFEEQGQSVIEAALQQAFEVGVLCGRAGMLCDLGAKERAVVPANVEAPF